MKKLAFILLAVFAISCKQKPAPVVMKQYRVEFYKKVLAYKESEMIYDIKMISIKSPNDVDAYQYALKAYHAELRSDQQKRNKGKLTSETRRFAVKDPSGTDVSETLGVRVIDSLTKSLLVPKTKNTVI